MSLISICFFLVLWSRVVCLGFSLCCSKRPLWSLPLLLDMLFSVFLPMNSDVSLGLFVICLVFVSLRSGASVTISVFVTWLQALLSSLLVFVLICVFIFLFRINRFSSARRLAFFLRQWGANEVLGSVSGYRFCVPFSFRLVALRLGSL